MNAALTGWHRVVESRDPALVRPLLADGVVFRSPAVHTPQAGVDRTETYLAAAVAVLGDSLRYHREWVGAGSAVLEFTATLDGLDVHGIDLIAWDAEERITEFTVMVRPQKGLAKLVELMGAELARGAGRATHKETSTR